MIEKIPLHLFYNCRKAKLCWDQLKEIISNTTLSIPSFKPQSVIIVFVNLSDDYLLIHHLILIYKFYIYNVRNNFLTLRMWKRLLIKLKALKKKLANMNLKTNLGILRYGIILLTILIKRCNRVYTFLSIIIKIIISHLFAFVLIFIYYF